MVEPHHFYVLSLSELYIYINISTAWETRDDNTEDVYRRRAARCRNDTIHQRGTSQKQRHTVKRLWGLSPSQILGGFSTLNSAVVVVVVVNPPVALCYRVSVVVHNQSVYPLAAVRI